jgi:catechol 2,3-dioxygenase-like lactoylglutathione lyase family enzyme
MLTGKKTHATLPASDLGRATQFYREKLGLTPTSESPDGNFYEDGDSRVFIFPSGGRASGSHTQMGWIVDDIVAEVADLKSHGVVFEEYDFPQFDKGTSVATTPPVKAAWFKDSEGNLLGLVQFI